MSKILVRLSNHFDPGTITAVSGGADTSLIERTAQCQPAQSPIARGENRPNILLIGLTRSPMLSEEPCLGHWPVRLLLLNWHSRF